ncbi:BIS (5'-NUCLEOSYL) TETRAPHOSPHATASE [Encephalitozoon cuniculi GB-M1]|uniref:BIS (5'-NUCLEOSYL) TETRAPHOSPHATASE n=2 Tax=Encephalitozoon cuniculi TaxID=6035 RepID=Q8SS98_ENCCU|nr:uncharacterized protein ECU03_0880 [Encephalitozoon cuniculi GB-M1]AGE95954.1 bis (5'-nucleosyl) tetraphosphatase [Encephalitozoon cuniculi]KMV66450.1 hypothetical protein M970_030800 [Encephalitozoon cuniculi EcunIII-L]CAD26232.1 BIS (5'-NUCLEOSYL) TETRAPHOSPHATASE [Encephalitozoon cuniculi GB-M1]
MKESEVIGKVEEVFGMEDPAVLPGRVRSVIDEILEGGVFPVSHPFYRDFMSLSFDVLYPDIQQPTELLKRSGFSRDQLEGAELRKLVDMVRQVSPEDAEGLLRPFEDPKPKRRKKVSWGANLIQVKEIEKTVMAPEADYLGSDPTSTSGKSPDSLEWIVPQKLTCGYDDARSPGLLEQERREAGSIRMYNTEEHRKFSPARCVDPGEDNETVVVPVMSFVKNKVPLFDFKKIVENRFRNMAAINEILEDPRVVDALLAKEEQSLVAKQL